MATTTKTKRTTPPTRAVRSNVRLVADLAKRLRSPSVLDEPFLLQDRVPQTRTRHVVVIWDRWAHLDRVARSGVILHAFESTGLLGTDTIAVAMGLTQQEAMQMGYLPYGIVTLGTPPAPLTLGQLLDAMEHVGGVYVRTGSSLQLRYPSAELAQEAYRQLTAKIPGPHWGITHETTTSGGQ